MAKQVIVMRKDLGMNRGKIAAQAAHASLGAVLGMMRRFEHEYVPEYPHTYELQLFVTEGSSVDEWLTGIFTKICVKVDSEEELLSLYSQAQEKGLPCKLITDRGLTEFHGIPTNTCIAIGPADDRLIDELTGHLKLYS